MQVGKGVVSAWELGPAGQERLATSAKFEGMGVLADVPYAAVALPTNFELARLSPILDRTNLSNR